MDLKEGTIYAIRYKFDKNRIFVGTFNHCIKDKRSNKINAKFENVTSHYSRRVLTELSFYNYTDYNYYDVHKINNAKYARQNMESRALNMVLKRLVNEYFEW